MNPSGYQYIYGPVPSRRLGRSLGVDLVPFKICSYDCIYCQLGRTTRKTTERKEWVPLEDVLEQLRPRLRTNPDYITLSGSGGASHVVGTDLYLGANPPDVDTDGFGDGTDVRLDASGLRVGSSLEPVPAPAGDGVFKGHVFALQEKGIYLLETMNTGPVLREGVNEFMFVLGQARVKGTVAV